MWPPCVRSGEPMGGVPPTANEGAVGERSSGATCVYVHGCDVIVQLYPPMHHATHVSRIAQLSCDAVVCVSL